jgi:hypothetical protein
MWLPTSLYERIPQFWLLLGILFLAFGLYLGFEFDLIYVYLGLGVACLARSVWSFKVRRAHRQKTVEDGGDSDADDKHTDTAVPHS